MLRAQPYSTPKFNLLLVLLTLTASAKIKENNTGRYGFFSERYIIDYGKDISPKCSVKGSLTEVKLVNTPSTAGAKGVQSPSVIAR